MFVIKSVKYEASHGQRKQSLCRWPDDDPIRVETCRFCCRNKRCSFFS